VTSDCSSGVPLKLDTAGCGALTTAGGLAVMSTCAKQAAQVPDPADTALSAVKIFCLLVAATRAAASNVDGHEGDAAGRVGIEQKDILRAPVGHN